MEARRLEAGARWVPGPEAGMPEEPAGSGPAEDPRPVHRSLPGYAPTPLRSVPVPESGKGRVVGMIRVKDEAHRFGLNAFKALGASYAIRRSLEEAPDRTAFATATEGNHGRAVAWAARVMGGRARIFVPDGTEPARVQAIRDEGAEVEVVPGSYEDAVDRARRESGRQGWVLIQDTAWEGYTTVPRQIMAGYTTAMREAEEQLREEAGGGEETKPGPDLVLVQGGVGSWAASVCGYLAARWGESAPRIVVVEPTAAACLLESVEAGRMVEASGSRRTAMAGLNCGIASTLAFDLLRRHASGFLAIDDRWSERAVELLSRCDPPIASAPAGAAGLGGLLALLEASGLAAARQALALGPTTRVLVFNTEGRW